ncbi:hypothetical protein [Mucilaginibacter sp.]|uniref:hypothetical protein n=1 Tax=Mucilaginibacter sp. TaxID=1882438 RepID=UPI00374CAA86
MTKFIKQHLIQPWRFKMQLFKAVFYLRAAHKQVPDKPTAVVLKKSLGYIIQIVMRSDDKKTGFKPTYKGWLVESRFSWLDNYRRLCRNYELLIESFENRVKLDAIKLLLSTRL